MSQDNEEKQAYIHRLETIVDAVKHLNSTLGLDELLSVILNLALENLNAANGTIYLVDAEKQQLSSRVLDGKEVVEITLPIGTGIAGTVAQTGETINLTDVGSDPRFFGGIDKRSGFTTKNMLCIPMRNRESKIIGVFQIINKHTGMFDQHDVSFLHAFSEHAAIAVENARLHEVLVAHARVKRELQIAAEIQQMLLPERMPPIPGYDIAAQAFPCMEVGGDFYDVLPLDDGNFAFVVADVSGKGVPAALLVSTLHASLHAHLDDLHDPCRVVAKLNDFVYRNSPPDRFITFLLMILNVKTHSISCINAGHNVPIFFRKEDGTLYEPEARACPLGMFGDQKYSRADVRLAPDDCLVLYTDGVTEAFNAEREEYGEDRLRQALLAHSPDNAAGLAAAIVEDVHRFVAGYPASDDLTLLVLKRAE